MVEKWARGELWALAVLIGQGMVVVYILGSLVVQSFGG
jgi:hypothetical protein